MGRSTMFISKSFFFYLSRSCWPTRVDVRSRQWKIGHHLLFLWQLASVNFEKATRLYSHINFSSLRKVSAKLHTPLHLLIRTCFYVFILCPFILIDALAGVVSLAIIIQALQQRALLTGDVTQRSENPVWCDWIRIKQPGKGKDSFRNLRGVRWEVNRVRQLCSKGKRMWRSLQDSLSSLADAWALWRIKRAWLASEAVSRLLNIISAVSHNRRATCSASSASDITEGCVEESSDINYAS